MGFHFEQRYWISRRLYLAGLGFIYFVIGLMLFQQGPALIGPEGLAPIERLTEMAISQGQSTWNLFRSYPSFLFFWNSDIFLQCLGFGVMALALILILGWGNLPVLFLLWLVQLSLVNGGGLFFSFGWETMMLEMTFLSFFIVHPWRLDLTDRRNWVPTFFSFFPLLWMLFRLMFGAGLIKVRGDACWLDFTCMNFHYETQPNPHFLSWYYHFAPQWFHTFEVLTTHFYELVVPFFLFLIRPLRILGALIIIVFQLTLISTGNLAFLNWQTIVLALVAFDDQFWLKALPTRWLPSSWNLEEAQPSRFNRYFSYMVCIGVLVLSYQPLVNMVSPQQRMNASFDRFHLINSYGLFGSITKKRMEIIISGAQDERALKQGVWKEYEFICKPGNVSRRPCWITPYHLRLDWQMWFSAMRPQLQEQWLLRLAHMMLTNHRHLDSLIELNPFPKDRPPQYLKMDLYHYQFSNPGSATTIWWTREFDHTYLPVISLKNFSK